MIVRSLSRSLMVVACTASSVPLFANTSEIEEIQVYGEPKQTSSATKLNLSIQETPQSVSVVSRPQIEDFALEDINSLLRYAPGVTVEYVETDRIYYTARGFDIVNFQYDGVGVPFSSGLFHGHQDTALFEQVEVVKGAAGLITGFANPSATVNYIRKRPTEDLGGAVSVSAGSEDRLRVQGDISGAISDRVRGRVVAVRDDGDSYLDRREEEKSLFYGVIEADLTEHTTLTVGHTFNRSRADGSMSGALPLFYSDGTQTNYSVSTSTATDWAFRDVDSTQSFVELKQQLNESWNLTLQYTVNKQDMEAEELYVYDTPNRNTEIGLLGYAFAYELDEKSKIIDAFVSGSFTLAGREHEMVIGYNYADIDLTGQSFYDYTNGFPVLGSDWASGNTPHPNFVDTDPYTTGHKDNQKHKAFYIATRLNITDQLSLLAGARRMSVDQKGFNYGTDVKSDASETVPYVGATFDINDAVTLYGSYSEVFTPQSWVTPDFQPLGVAEGENAEVGIKVSLNDGLATGTLALFQSKLDNLGEFNRVVAGVNTYDGLNYETNGAELEIIGSINDATNISFGITHLDKVEGDDGEKVRTYLPRTTIKLASAIDISAIPGLTLGASVNWQDDIYIEPAANVRVDQDSYALVNAFARYRLSDDVTLSLNVNNLTDKKYINSLYWTQGFYGAPRQMQASVNWQF